MCETRDLGMEWPYWHTLTVEGEARIDMRYVCPKNVKKMLLQPGQSTGESGKQNMNMKN